MNRRFAFVHPALFALTVGLCAFSRPALADRVTAEALFQSGREALDRGDYQVACDRFEESYRQEPTPGTALNLGNCREQLGQVASAWQRFQEAAQTLPLDDPRVEVARARAEALKSKIPLLTLRAPAGSSTWVVLKDGVAVGTASLNLALPVDPGAHAIEVRAPGRKPWLVQVELRMSEPQEVLLAQGEVAPQVAERSSPPDTMPVARSSSGGSRRTVGWVLGGVGVAGIATSLGTGAVVLSKSSTVNKECPNKQCSPEGLNAADAGRTLSTISSVAFVAGAAFIGVGVYFLLSDPTPKEVQQGKASRGSEGRRTRLEATGSTGAFALQLKGDF